MHNGVLFNVHQRGNHRRLHAPDYMMGEEKTSSDHLAVGKLQRLIIQRLVALYDSEGEYFECGGSSSAHSTSSNG